MDLPTMEPELILPLASMPQLMTMASGDICCFDGPDELWAAFDEHLKSCSKFGRSRENFYGRFAKLKTNLDRINLVLEELNHAHISATFVLDYKDDDLAEQMKQEGNLHFGKAEYSVALDSYTKCIVQAERKELLALGYANRSAALFKLNLFEECVEDIDRALANEYPAKLHSKLTSRRQEALERKNQPRRAEHEEIPQISNKNPKIQCASDSVEISHNAKYGKYVIATKDIEIGEVIAVEEPFACLPTKSYYMRGCHHCSRFVYNPLPCPSCTVAVYCNEVCKEKAFEVYHKYECDIAMSLEAFLMNHTDSLVPLRMAFIINNEEAHAEEDEMYRSDRSTEILKLSCLADKRPDQELLNVTLIAALVFQLVKKNTNFFNSSSDNCEEKFKEILQTAYLVGSPNYSGIYIWADLMKTGFFDGDHAATGIYSFFSLFNHSCCPNVTRAFYGSTMVLIAIKTIKKGSQCFLSYGCLYGMKSFSVRQEICQRLFYFTCTCEACEQFWPPPASLPKTTPVAERINMAQVCARLRTLDVVYARQIFPALLCVYKEFEHMEPCPDLFVLHALLVRCIDSHTSKRIAY